MLLQILSCVLLNLIYVAGRVKVVTEFHQLLPDGSLREVKALLDSEKPLPKPQMDAGPAQGVRESPLRTEASFTMSSFSVLQSHAEGTGCMSS